MAAYLQAEIQPHERLHLTAGGRYEQFALDSVSEGRPVFRTGLNYRFGQASYPRASVGQGFRFPSIAEKFIAELGRPRATACSTLGSAASTPERPG